MPLLVIDGLDGSGKTTQCNELKKYFNEKNISWKYIHFPIFNNEYGEKIKSILNGKNGSIKNIDPKEMAILYVMNRLPSREIINNYLKNGEYVILDRYTHSTAAYQTAMYEINNTNFNKNKFIKNIFKLEYATNKMPKPDVSIFLDVPMDFIKLNLQKKSNTIDREYLSADKKLDLFEKNLFFLSKVRDNYLSFDNLNIINCFKNNSLMEIKSIKKIIIDLIDV